MDMVKERQRSPPKRQNIKEKEGEGESDACRDRLSNLPDNLIHHILSFMDTIYAVRTSVLSRRWRHLWTSIPCLSFDVDIMHFATPDEPEIYEGEWDHFMDLVDEILIRRDGSDIRKFRFRDDDVDFLSKVNRLERALWYAVRHNVQELQLEINGDGFEFPPCIFSCESLRTLELNPRLQCMDFYNPMGFVGLKTMYLCCFNFEENTSGDPFSTCPVLENLVLEHCCFPPTEVFSISALQLTNLVILNPIKNRTCPSPKMMISAPRLTSFKYESCVTLNFNFQNLCSIDKVDINLCPFERSRPNIGEDFCVIPQELAGMLKGLRNAKDVVLSFLALQVLSTLSGLESEPSPFCNLKSLRLRHNHNDIITYLIKDSPSFETMVVDHPRLKLENTGEHGCC
ncbi:PREDICTED: F-box/LRR-repeat protein 25-like [Nelumbo nucifera]|uniref:F-box/LRR-repeat protein 25-like n=2 Tax=Nelumbo nucifera TaxID=4432 RepID=A0A1U8AZA7_NELNU|nr:PREDICTED: F-box/LRR-repeat protein 25-like [Nelumbo nucifera]DAD23049.1 TPA_asm: hypothetical protein HUJ06_024512 [Nelumbo nucifera]